LTRATPYGRQESSLLEWPARCERSCLQTSVSCPTWSHAFSPTAVPLFSREAPKHALSLGSNQRKEVERPNPSAFSTASTDIDVPIYPLHKRTLWRGHFCLKGAHRSGLIHLDNGFFAGVGSRWEDFSHP
jgi:hypothetical protein